MASFEYQLWKVYVGEPNVVQCFGGCGTQIIKNNSAYGVVVPGSKTPLANCRPTCGNCKDKLLDPSNLGNFTPTKKFLSDRLNKFTVVELKELLKNNNQKLSGTKVEIIDRIVDMIVNYKCLDMYQPVNIVKAKQLIEQKKTVQEIQPIQTIQPTEKKEQSKLLKIDRYIIRQLKNYANDELEMKIKGDNVEEMFKLIKLFETIDKEYKKKELIDYFELKNIKKGKEDITDKNGLIGHIVQNKNNYIKKIEANPLLCQFK